jgi:4-hydroxy-tetrahydrodipicolinate reductase
MTETWMKLVVAGASGRMGQALIRAIAATPGVMLAGALERTGAETIGSDAGLLAGIGSNGVVITDDILPVLAEADGLIDFTIPAATVVHAGYAAQAGIVHVIGTTGCSAQDEAAIDAAAFHTAIVKSGNMSLGVNLLAVLVEQAAAALDAANWDIDVLEMHHRHKIDAPSGTALLLGASAAKGRGVTLEDVAVRSRDGITGERQPGSIGFATLRGGSVIGEHSVILAGTSEVIELTHKATDRSLFANGALRAALWARGRKPGRYSMRDVLGLPN